MAATVAGCVASRQAAQLATVTSGHVNTLNAELKAYVDAANSSRKSDAQRIASAQIYWDQQNLYLQPFLTEWEIDKTDSLSNAFSALQKQSAAEMAITDGYIKRQSDATTQLQNAYGQLTYTPAQLQSVISALQTLASRDSDQTQLAALKNFASTTLADAKKDLNAAKPPTNGIAP